MEFKIDKHIPIPSKKKDSIQNAFLDQLEIGDSFSYGQSNLKDRRRCSVMISNYSKATGKRFTVRTTPEGIRVWRIDPNTPGYKNVTKKIYLNKSNP